MRQELIEQLFDFLGDTYASLFQTLAEAIPDDGTPDNAQYIQRNIQLARETFRTTENGKRLREKLEKEPDSRFDYYRLKFRREIPPYVSKGLGAAWKRLPRPSGGRPSALTDEEKSTVCSDILKCIGAGATERQAIRQVAAQQQASLRTIQRVWKERVNHLTTATADPPKEAGPMAVKAAKRARSRRKASKIR